MFRRRPGQHANNVELGRHGRNRSNFWTYRGFNAFGQDRDALLACHPTVKPVAMIADALRDVTKRGGVVLDTFMGSGSTLMAAEETGRVCSAPSLIHSTSMSPSVVGRPNALVMPFISAPASSSMTARPALRARTRL